MTLILGINAYHGDSSACLLKDGYLIAAAEEERFRRIKHWAGFPSEAIKYCLDEAGVRLNAVQHVAINQDSKANLWRKWVYALAKRPSPALVLDRLRTKRARSRVEDQLERTVGDGFAGVVHHVEHHLAHLSSAFLVAPFKRAVVVSVDGFGDFASAAWGLAENDRIDIHGRIYFPHSLGIFYEAITQYLGFPHYGDEYKVMGLASYGQPRYVEQMRDVVLLQDDGTFRLNLDYFRHQTEKVEYQWESGAPQAHTGNLFSDRLIHALGPARQHGEDLAERHKDIARSAQAMYEEAFFSLLRKLHGTYGVDALALAGGCAMNSVANGKVYQQTPFKQLYVQSAAGDAGGAIGAAFAVSRTLPMPHAHKNGDKFVMDHAYWGPEFSESQLRELLLSKQDALNAAACTVDEELDERSLCSRTAQAICEGKVIGWFQGRMEWGPRALGNRSILADPRRTDMQQILNLKIKRRESFRPFAPSILREHVADWFEMDDEVPFMMQVFQIREGRREQIPAVTHVDGSGRLQTVSQSSNPRYYRLIDTFREMTGVPILLNTSFNENEPVVCRPEEALDCFLRTRMDLLVLGNFLVSRAG